MKKFSLDNFICYNSFSKQANLMLKTSHLKDVIKNESTNSSTKFWQIDGVDLCILDNCSIILMS